MLYDPFNTANTMTAGFIDWISANLGPIFSFRP